MFVVEIVAVHGMKDDRSSEPWPQDLAEAVNCSKQLAAWAPGLKWKLVDSWARRTAEQKAQLRALRDGECEHIVCGHIPFRRDCGECLRAPGTEPGHARCSHRVQARPRQGQEEDKARTQSRATEPSHRVQRRGQ